MSTVYSISLIKTWIEDDRFTIKGQVKKAIEDVRNSSDISSNEKNDLMHKLENLLLIVPDGEAY